MGHSSRLPKHHAALQAILAIRRAARAIDDIVDAACEQLGITGVQYNILRILSRAPAEGIPRSHIVAQLVEKHADVTRSIDGLVAAGYVEREHATYDRRVVLHRITAAGRAAIEQVDPFLFEALRQIARHFTTAELETLTKLLKRFLRYGETIRLPAINATEQSPHR
ncbi:MAG: MarR family winged helix-turn-helix transcriptional regulator [Bacteroidota bacterium]|nr:MarR family winged helix-turn-helix transcriptional regulator [Candidatus Kapabacteria bacterium]MDW8272529.1 MarR family winged helix-turn-helix transcriptional regulator [Bacteroidota bacterium]